MTKAQMLMALLEAVLTGLRAGLTDKKTDQIIDLASQGVRLANAATTTGENFLVAMVSLTNQVKAMAIAGTQDLTDEQQATLDKKVQDAHQEIQDELAARHAAEDPRPPASTTPVAPTAPSAAAPSAALGSGELSIGSGPGSAEDPPAS